MTWSERTLTHVRRFLLALLAVGLVVTAVDLVLLDHYEDFWQYVPLVLIAVAVAVLSWHGLSQTVASIRALQATMVLFVLASGLGLFFHYDGSRQFQLETDPTQHGWPLVLKVLRSKAPPAVAPAVMAELGLLGLGYAYCHPARNRRHTAAGATTDDA